VDGGKAGVNKPKILMTLMMGGWVGGVGKHGIVCSGRRHFSEGAVGASAS
jgi:hypothetical protein